jgi:YesN/AraC family two-component response regulator
VKLVDDLPIVTKIKLSEFLSIKIGKDYTNLSKLFSRVEGVTIEKYFINLKVEKAKELIQDCQLNFTQIAYDLGYGNVNYLSNQFKQFTGMSMSTYKNNAVWKRKPIDEIL